MSFTNRLINEKSPYLIQHAHNPVDWYPWGEEAFERARKEDKPIFLSIGYATCHWCHVMETESFENPEIAALLNEAFVNIKVDREEHPEVDSIYMEFAQALMSAPGGWPLNVVLTPDLKPFFAVTYLPPKTRKGLIGVDQFIQQISMLWKSDDRAHLIAQADKIVELFAKAAKTSGEDLPDEQLLEDAIQTIFDLADPVFGGIKGEPKFPLSYQAALLLQYSKAHSDSRALFYVDLTLEMMARGGIYDHLGGGFARYAIDERWQIPHFEKMLYDNALLAETYLNAYQFTKKANFAAITRACCDYVLREMVGQEGGFFSAQDADSDGVEGSYYTWTRGQIEGFLPPEESELFCRYYGVTWEGNFEGRSILHVDIDRTLFAETLKLKPEQLDEKLQHAREVLFKKRSERTPPFKDDKVITGWNGLMIQALAKAGAVLSDDRYRDAALKAAQFIKEKLVQQGVLMHRYRDGEARFFAGLEDYAFLIRALITLFETGAGSAFLKWAIELADEAERTLKSPEGAFYQSREDPHLLMRKCDFYDGAEPSGNAVHAENLIRLYQLTQQEKYLKAGEDILKAVRQFIEAFAPGACYHLLALQHYLNEKAPLVVVALNDAGALKKEINEALFQQFNPHATIVWKEKGDPLIDQLLPFCSEQLPVEGETALYVCRGIQCEKPVTGKEAILQAIHNL